MIAATSQMKRKKLVLTDVERGAFEVLAALCQKIKGSVFIDTSKYTESENWFSVDCSSSQKTVDEAVQAYNDRDPLAEKREEVNSLRAKAAQIEQEIKEEEGG